MRKSILLSVPVLAALALAGCTSMGEPEGGPTATLINSAGQAIGTARMWQTPGGTTFRIEARGLPLGIHAVHVHTTGRCDPPGFTTAGPHWNPAKRQHGFDNPNGPHAGDMPNVTVSANGVLQETVTLAGASFASMLDADGAALVIHAARDDYRTDPSGNSGDRIACAVLNASLPLAS